MWPIADLVTFTDKILNEKLYFCAVLVYLSFNEDRNQENVWQKIYRLVILISFLNKKANNLIIPVLHFSLFETIL